MWILSNIIHYTRVTQVKMGSRWWLRYVRPHQDEFMHMSHDSNNNMKKGPFVYRQTYLANLQAYQDPVEYHCGLYNLIANV